MLRTHLPLPLVMLLPLVAACGSSETSATSAGAHPLKDQVVVVASCAQRSNPFAEAGSGNAYGDSGDGGPFAGTQSTGPFGSDTAPGPFANGATQDPFGNACDNAPVQAAGGDGAPGATNDAGGSKAATGKGPANGAGGAAPAMQGAAGAPTVAGGAGSDVRCLGPAMKDTLGFCTSAAKPFSRDCPGGSPSPDCDLSPTGAANLYCCPSQ